MASHADRLQQSSCFQNSEMSCITCHDPHHSVKKPQNYFNKMFSCLTCDDKKNDEFQIVFHVICQNLHHQIYLTLP